MKSSDTNARRNASDSPAQSSHAEKTAHTQLPLRNDESDTTRVPQSAHTESVRRRFLQLLGSASVLSVAGCLSSVTGKTAKNEVNYQDQPKGNQQCSNCQFYTPPEDGTNAGTCSRVKGDIEPDDWCSVYAKG